MLLQTLERGPAEWQGQGHQQVAAFAGDGLRALPAVTASRPLPPGLIREPARIRTMNGRGSVAVILASEHQLPPPRHKPASRVLSLHSGKRPQHFTDRSSFPNPHRCMQCRMGLGRPGRLLQVGLAWLAMWEGAGGGSLKAAVGTAVLLLCVSGDPLPLSPRLPGSVSSVLLLSDLQAVFLPTLRHAGKPRLPESRHQRQKGNLATLALLY